ncbi:hypothetical protein SV1_52 [Streptomyces phage SV1]|uniref:hypothetical protein n=1 Tax=Streptomyces phage SV1 TaxID=1204525 RepID=UPI00028B8149|nr:hypothetical protein D280_gp52 [Streptomyces phage SV1]AFU62192.1 hypothetical protein SV1_52 [Streptomyces phage SV1]
METVIPGALADHLTRQTITDTETTAVLDAARRGRGRTLVIEPTSTRVLHVISAYAEAILENRSLHTTAEARAARLWMQRAGHAPAAVVAPVAEEQAPAPVRDEPSDWWTIMDPVTGKEAARVYGETYQEMTPRAEALPEVRAIIRKHRGFSRRRLSVSELTADQLAQQHDQEQQRAAARLDLAEQQAAAEPAPKWETTATGQKATPHYSQRPSVGASVTVCGTRTYTRVPLTVDGPAVCRTCDRGRAVLDAEQHDVEHRLTAGAKSGVRHLLIPGTASGYCGKPVGDTPAPSSARDCRNCADLADKIRRFRTDLAADAAFAAAAHAADAVEHAEQVEAGVATVAEAVTLYDAHLAADAAAEAETLLDDELRLAAALVTEAEATAGTWRGEWIGDTPGTDVLFIADRTVEQGALFDDRATT